MKQPTQETIEPIDAPEKWSDYRKNIEKRIGGELIDLPTLKGLGYEELTNSLERLGRFVDVNRSLLIANRKDRISIRFYTERNVYFISAKIGSLWNERGHPDRPKIDGDGYLGAQVTCRTPVAGEWWNRGRDLADGPYSKETLENILLDIVAYEIEPLADWITER